MLLPYTYTCVGVGLHELDAVNDQEVKDFRSKTFRISEERMQCIHMMTCTEWLEACFSPQLEPAAGTALTNGLSDRTADLKVIIHFVQSQVGVSILQCLYLCEEIVTRRVLSVCIVPIFIPKDDLNCNKYGMLCSSLKTSTWT